MTKIHHPHKLPPVVSRGRNRILRKGSSHSHWRDPYHWLLTISADKFVAVIIIAYTIANSLFALLYLAGGDCIANARPRAFADAFYFSVQTMASIGYGAMYPKTDYANMVVAIEALVGLMFLAMATGLMFARFSRPTAKVLFSKVAVVAPYNGKPTLKFRTANERHNQIFEAEMHVSLVRDEVSLEGTVMRRFYDLKLVRNQTPIFALTWTGMHIIDEDSPLYGETEESLHHSNIEIIVILTGVDETVAQTIHSRHSYLAEEILWDYSFVDILYTMPDGKRLIDYTHFHDVTKL